MVNQVIMVISPDRNQAGVMVACLQDAGYRAAAAEISEGAMDDHCRQNPDQCWREPFNPRVLVARVRAFLRRDVNRRDPKLAENHPS